MKLKNLRHISKTVSRLQTLQEEMGISCPNFFLSGPSQDTLEEAALYLLKALSHSTMINFSGAVKNFTLGVPCFTSAESAVHFLNRLEESVNIATDIYSSFRGVILLLLDAGWAQVDDLSRFEPVLHAIRSHPELCFLVVLPVSAGGDDSRVKKALYSCAAWVEMEIQLPNARQCVDELCESAKRSGFLVTEEAERYLLEAMKDGREEPPTPETLSHMLHQIVLERRLSGDCLVSIGILDVQRFVQPVHRREPMTIGFALSEPKPELA